MKKHLPNFITCLNLLCGCLAVVQAFNGNLVNCAYLVFLGMVFDFLDGMLARLLKAYSAIGKELDSMADMVSFGLVPGVLVYKLLEQAHPEIISEDPYFLTVIKFFPFIITIFSALRLAKFNIDTRQTTSFIGVPTPAVALFFASFPLVIAQGTNTIGIRLISNPYVLVGLTLVMSFLLVSEIPLFSLKFKNLRWKDNRIQFIFLMLILPLALFFFYSAIPMVFFLYVILSLLNNINKPKVLKL